MVCGRNGPLIQIGAGLPVELGPLTVTFTTDTNVTVAGGTISAGGSSDLMLLPPGTATVTAVINDAIGITRLLINETVGCVA